MATPYAIIKDIKDIRQAKEHTAHKHKKLLLTVPVAQPLRT